MPTNKEDDRMGLPLDPDDDGGFMGLLAAIHLEIGGAHREMRNMRERMEREAKQTSYRILYPRAVSAIVSATGLAIFDFGGPDQGIYWSVRSIRVGGLTTTTAVAGRADVFVTAVDIPNTFTVANMGLADWRDQQTALPAVAFYGRGALTCQLNEDLYVFLSGGTPGQQVVATMNAELFDEAAIVQGFAE
jgi:hypothetical protein